MMRSLCSLEELGLGKVYMTNETRDKRCTEELKTEAVRQIVDREYGVVETARRLVTTIDGQIFIVPARH